MSIFQGLTEQQFDLLEPMMDVCHFVKGQIIFEQGQTAENLYILIDGEVVIRYKPYDGPPLTVARILPGGVFGWSAAMAREVYTSEAVAETDSEGFQLNGNLLRSVCDCNPEAGTILLERLTSVVAERLRSTHDHILLMLSQGMDLNGDCAAKAAEKVGRNERK